MRYLCDDLLMGVHVGKSALRRRRNELCRGADQVNKEVDTATVCLLLFYAAECGLKACKLERGGHRSTSALRKTHDLRELAKDLGLPKELWGRLNHLGKFRRTDQNNAAVELSELHNVWRYGARLTDADNKDADSALRALIAWCEQD